MLSSDVKRILYVLNLPIQDKIRKGLTKGWRYKRSRTVVCGQEHAFQVPAGLSYSYVVERLESLSASLGHEVEADDYKGTVVIRVIEKDFPKRLTFHPDHLRDDSLLIGYNRLLEPVYHPLNVHMLQGGAAGSGKTDWQRWVAYQLIRQGYHVWILDLKGYSFFPFVGIPNVTIATSLPASLILLEQAQCLLEKRKAIIDQSRTREVIKSFTPLVILIDEAASLAPSQYPSGYLKEQARKCDLIIGLLGCQSREPKIFVIYGTQRPDMTVINKQFKANVEASVAFRTKDHINSQIIIDRPGAEKISPSTPGRCIYSYEKDHLLQVPYIGGDPEWEELLKPMKGVHHDQTEDSNRIIEAAHRIYRANRETDRKYLTAQESELLFDKIMRGKTGDRGILPPAKDLETDQEGPDIDGEPDDEI